MFTVIRLSVATIAACSIVTFALTYLVPGGLSWYSNGVERLWVDRGRVVYLEQTGIPPAVGYYFHSFPLWPLPVLCTSLLGIVIWRDRRRARLANPDACPRCSYSLAGLAPLSPCPECGHVHRVRRESRGP